MAGEASDPTKNGKPIWEYGTKDADNSDRIQSRVSKIINLKAIRGSCASFKAVVMRYVIRKQPVLKLVK